MDRCQAIKSLVGEEGVGPALMVGSPTAPTQAVAFTEEAAKPHPYPPVQIRERRFVAVFEVFKPASERRRERHDRPGEAVAGFPWCLRADRVLELVQALGPRVAAP